MVELQKEVFQLRGRASVIEDEIVAIRKHVAALRFIGEA